MEVCLRLLGWGVDGSGGINACDSNRTSKRHRESMDVNVLARHIWLAQLKCSQEDRILLFIRTYSLTRLRPTQSSGRAERKTPRTKHPIFHSFPCIEIIIPNLDAHAYQKIQIHSAHSSMRTSSIPRHCLLFAHHFHMTLYLYINVILDLLMEH